MKYAANQVNPEADDWCTCMIHAFYNGNLEVIQYIVEQLSLKDPGSIDRDQFISGASARGQRAIVDFLEQCKAKASKNEN